MYGELYPPDSFFLSRNANKIRVLVKVKYARGVVENGEWRFRRFSYRFLRVPKNFAPSEVFQLADFNFANFETVKR